MAATYRLSPAFTARLMGGTLVLLAALILVSTALVAVFDLHTVWLVVPAAVALVVIIGVAVLISRSNPAVRFTDEGYVVRGFRGAGEKSARWKDVEDVITTHRGNLPCTMIRLKNGTSTTIPVTALDGDREQFVRDLLQHVQTGQGYRGL